MNKELHKRIEEAAVDITVDIIDRNPQPVYFAAIREAAFRGAEHGYKEAIAMAKKWIINEIGNYSEIDYLNTKPFIAILNQRAAEDFEDEMNKLLEEKK